MYIKPIPPLTAITLCASLFASSALAGTHHTHSPTAEPAPPPPATTPATVAERPAHHGGETRARLLFVGLLLGPSYSFNCCAGTLYGGFGFWANGYIGLTFSN